MIDTTTALDHTGWHAAALIQVEDYARLADEYAAQGDARRAALATWAADLMTLQCLLWENGLGQAPDPAAQLAAVGQAVTGSLHALDTSPGVAATARATVEAARAALTATFDASVHALLTERLISLEHLDRIATAGSLLAFEEPTDRLDGRATSDLIADLQVTAQDCRAVAAAMKEAGLPDAAEDQERMADLAAFEGHLVDAAVTAGDSTLVSVDLRWQLATSSIIDAPVSQRLVRSVAPVEGSVLMRALSASTHAVEPAAA